MKYYSLHIFMYPDYCSLHLSKDDINQSTSISINNWMGEPDWSKLMHYIKFFDSEFVVISPRFDNADDFTTDPALDMGKPIYE